MTTLVTGSNGRIGRGIVNTLTAQGHSARPATSTPTTAQLAAGVVHCDLRDPATVRTALTGADTVFLYAEPDTITEFIELAIDNRVRHIVLLSSSAVLAPNAAENAVGRRHLEVEQALMASELTCTLLRPGAFATNALQWAKELRETGTVRLPYPRASVAPIHEKDIAATAVAVITGSIGRGQAHTLTGPTAITFAEQLAIIGVRRGTPIAVTETTAAEARARLLTSVGPELADTLLCIWRRASENTAITTDAVHHLTGHRPAPFEEWVTDHLTEFQP
jgi:uncharacterized protein YbjT (DUF2867 family)